VEIYTQEIQKMNLKSTINLLKFIVLVLFWYCSKVLYVDMAMDMHDANGTEQLGHVAYPCEFSERHWR